MNEVDTIRKIAKTLAPFYTFPGYTEDDIEQEAFIIGLQVLDRFDSSKSALATFLYIHINNRLHTFKRDKFINRVKNEEKFRLMYPIPIESVKEHLSFSYDPLENLITQELLFIIDRELPVSLREDYLRLKDGTPLSQTRRSNLLNKLREIVEEHYA